jgi:hypothetical protein
LAPVEEQKLKASNTRCVFGVIQNDARESRSTPWTFAEYRDLPQAMRRQIAQDIPLWSAFIRQEAEFFAIPTLLQSPGCRRDWHCITCFAANRMTGARMDLSEKVLYHQIHPAKLAADITGSIISTYLMWHRRFGPAMLGAWAPAILGS